MVVEKHAAGIYMLMVGNRASEVNHGESSKTLQRSIALFLGSDWLRQLCSTDGTCSRHCVESEVVDINAILG
jgi:hypothetical protein